MADPELYLFTGPEIGEKNDKIASLKDAFRKKYGAVDEYTYYSSDARMADIIAQLQNQGLFTTATFIVLKNAEAVKTKDDIELLSSWAQSGSTNTLVLTTDENSVDRKLENCVPSKNRQQFWEMFEDRKQQWLSDYFRKNGFSIESDAVDSILEMVENNTQSLKSECTKFFFCFEKGHKITEEDVDKILAHTREENAFTLFDAMCDTSVPPAERFENSVNILQKIKLANKGSYASSVISGLLWSFRMLKTWHMLYAGGSRPSDSDLRNCGFSGKTKQVKFRKAAGIWGPGVTASIIALLARTEMDCRSNPQAEDTQLTLMVYSIVVKNGVFCSTYETDL